jgi:glucokinase
MGFNFQGSDTFQTPIGGILSVIATCIVLACFIFKADLLIRNDNWDLNSQTVMLTEDDLDEQILMKDYQNITMGIQMMPGINDWYPNDTEYT